MPIAGLPMKIFRTLLCGALLLAGACGAHAQSPYLFYVTLRGSSYQTNDAGVFVPVPMSDQSILADAARAGGITDLKTLALVYHINGSSFGDTIDVVNSSTGASLKTVFGFYFGDDPTLNRLALTNSATSEVRRIDYIYTDQSSHSMGTAFLTKRFVTDAKDNVRTTIDAQMQWIVTPIGNDGVKICKASFTTTTPFRGSP